MNISCKLLAVSFAGLALAGCNSMMMGSNSSAPRADNRPEPVVMMVPVQLTDPALASGCWVQMYDERNFTGSFITLTGPGEFQSLDKDTGKALRRKIDSMVIGPKATLQVYERALFKDRMVTFGPNSREPGLITKLGFGGNIQSLRLDCTS